MNIPAFGYNQYCSRRVSQPSFGMTVARDAAETVELPSIRPSTYSLPTPGFHLSARTLLFTTLTFMTEWQDFIKRTPDHLPGHPIVQRRLTEATQEHLDYLKRNLDETGYQRNLEMAADVILAQIEKFPDGFARPILEASGKWPATK